MLNASIPQFIGKNGISNFTVSSQYPYIPGTSLGTFLHIIGSLNTVPKDNKQREKCELLRIMDNWID
jgi:hypothetical protein